MTTIQFNLPDAIAQRARSEGLLTDEAIRELLEDALRRQAGRRLTHLTERLHAAAIDPMPDEQIDAEIAQAREAMLMTIMSLRQPLRRVPI